MIALRVIKLMVNFIISPGDEFFLTNDIVYKTVKKQNKQIIIFFKKKVQQLNTEIY